MAALMWAYDLRNGSETLPYLFQSVFTAKWNVQVSSHAYLKEKRRKNASFLLQSNFTWLIILAILATTQQTHCMEVSQEGGRGGSGASGCGDRSRGVYWGEGVKFKNIKSFSGEPMVHPVHSIL